MQTRNWNVQTDNCEGSGLNELCSIVAAGTGGQLQIVEKHLACGCVLTLEVSADE